MSTFNQVVHFEIHAGDPERAVKFYTDAFGWDIKKWEGGAMEYWLVMAGPDKSPGAIHGGIVRRMGDAPAPTGPVNGYVNSISVENIDISIEKILACGGTVALPKFDIPDVGSMAYFKDTEGNIFGIWQEIKKA